MKRKTYKYTFQDEKKSKIFINKNNKILLLRSHYRPKRIIIISAIQEKIASFRRKEKLILDKLVCNNSKHAIS